MFTTENVQFDAIQFLARPRTAECCIENRLAPQTTVQQTVCSNALCQNSRFRSRIDAALQNGYGDINHVGTKALRCTFCDIHSNYKAQVCFATHLRAMCTVFTRQRSAVRHTSMRSAQYLQHGGLRWDAPPRDLHSNYRCFRAHYLFRRCALRHTSARSAQFLRVFVGIGHVFF